MTIIIDNRRIKARDESGEIIKSVIYPMDSMTGNLEDFKRELQAELGAKRLPAHTTISI